MEFDPASRLAPSLAPEHDWAAASRLVRPALRPVGTPGTDGSDLRVPAGGGGLGKPIMTNGPAGLPIVYVIPGPGFEVVVDVEHLLAWGVRPDQVHAAAMSNLAAWSASAGWSDESNGRRRIVWSDTGEGLDAARILLAAVRRRLVSDLAPAHRILVGLPERDLLIAAALVDGDDEFADLFADYVADRARAADEPIDRRIFELRDGDLVEAGAPFGA
ncbi:MAG: hypothetical protein ABSG37_09015 [Candidatus Limnocylindrales bacterium]|jgi:hypothetical protein